MKDIKLKKIEKVDENLLQEIVKRIVEAVNPWKIVLFGSWAYGNPQKHSDVDILVVMDNSIKSRHSIASEVYRALSGLLIPKDIVVTTLNDIEEWKDVPQAFITTILRKGKVIYEKKD
jgi:predicted nucleotidyltransferase